MANEKTVAVVKMPTLYTTDAQFDKARRSIVTRGASLQKDIHILLMSSIAKLDKDGDIRGLAKDIECLPDMARKNAARAWLEAHAKVAFDGNRMVYAGTKTTMLAKANNKPFWAFKPEERYVALDLAKYLDSIIKRLEKDAEKTNVDHSAIINTLKLVKAPEAGTAQQ